MRDRQFCFILLLLATLTAIFTAVSVQADEITPDQRPARVAPTLEGLSSLRDQIPAFVTEAKPVQSSQPLLERRPERVVPTPERLNGLRERMEARTPVARESFTQGITVPSNKLAELPSQRIPYEPSRPQTGEGETVLMVKLAIIIASVGFCVILAIAAGVRSLLGKRK